MIIYWIFFTFLSIFSISPLKLEKNFNKITKLSFSVILIIFIGFRHEVGGDWDIYKFDFNNKSKLFSLYPLTFYRDFGYDFIQYITKSLNLEIYSLNLIQAIIFVYGLTRFCKIFAKDNYWLALLISFPYLITVVAMGFTRQSTAIGLILIALTYFKDNKLLYFFVFSFLAILFHKSSIIFIPIILLSGLNLNLKYFFLLFSIILISIIVIVPELHRIETGYINKDSIYVSKGVIYRISLNILSGLIFIIFYKKLKFDKIINLLLLYSFLFNIIMIFFISDYSTFVDRIIIYFVFMQIIIFSRLFYIIPKYKILFNFYVILIYSINYFIWFNFSIHSYAWLPYKNLFINF